jgi:hypothetical protein
LESRWRWGTANKPGREAVSYSHSCIFTAMGKFSEAFKHSDHKEPIEPPPTFHEATFQPPPQIHAGSSSSQAPSFACLLLSSSDKIRTVNFPEHTLSHIEEAIKRVWAPGIQAQKYQAPGNYEWKLTGRPCMSPCCDVADGRVRFWGRSYPLSATHYSYPPRFGCYWMAYPYIGRLDKETI